MLELDAYDKRNCMKYFFDIFNYLNKIQIEEYKKEYRKLRADSIPFIKAQKFKSAHTELRRLNRKKESVNLFFAENYSLILKRAPYCKPVWKFILYM